MKIQISDKNRSHTINMNRPTSHHQFTSPITYNNDHKRLISSVYDRSNKTSHILLWNTNHLEINSKHLIPITNLQDEDEFVVRIYHSDICHDYFIIVTNLVKSLYLIQAQKHLIIHQNRIMINRTN